MAKPSKVPPTHPLAPITIAPFSAAIPPANPAAPTAVLAAKDVGSAMLPATVVFLPINCWIVKPNPNNKDPIKAPYLCIFLIH